MFADKCDKNSTPMNVIDVVRTYSFQIPIIFDHYPFWEYFNNIEITICLDKKQPLLQFVHLWKV